MLQHRTVSGFEGDETARVRAVALLREVRRSQRRRRLVAVCFLPFLLLYLVLVLVLILVGFGEFLLLGGTLWEWFGKRFTLPDSHWQDVHAQLRRALPAARSPEALSRLLELVEVLATEKHPEARVLVRVLQEHLALRLAALPTGEIPQLSGAARRVLTKQVRSALRTTLPVDYVVAALLTLACQPTRKLVPVVQQLAQTPQSERIREAAGEYLKAVS